MMDPKSPHTAQTPMPILTDASEHQTLVPAHLRLLIVP